MTKIALIVVGIIAIFLAGAAFSERLSFLGGNSQPSIKSEEPKAEKPQENTSSDLQTFENKDYGFSFSYPKGYDVNRHMESNGNSMDGFLISGPDNFEQSLWVYKTACLEKCFQNEIINWEPKNKLDGKQVTISGISGYELNLDGNPDGKGAVVRNIYLAKGGLVVYFEFPNLKSSQDSISEIQQQILDSFKFN